MNTRSIAAALALAVTVVHFAAAGYKETSAAASSANATKEFEKQRADALRPVLPGIGISLMPFRKKQLQPSSQRYSPP